jgi:O-antigen/teichoic acid export membrane protein
MSEFNIRSQFENPIVSSIVISCLTMIIVFFILSYDEIYNIFYLGLILFFVNYVILHFHYIQLKRKFKKEIVNSDVTDVIQQATGFIME